MEFKIGDKVRYKPITKIKDVLEYYNNHLNNHTVYTVLNWWELGGVQSIELDGVKNFEIICDNLELYIDEDEIPFTITCNKCGSTNCTIVPCAGNYVIECIDCDSEYSSR